MTALLTLPLVAIAAVPNIFQPNTVISSNAVNPNFSALDARITALEAATAKTSATMVMSNVQGPLSTTAAPVRLRCTRRAASNPLLLVVSGSAWNASGGSMDVTVQFDGAIVGHLSGTTNEASSHKTLPMRAITIPTPAAGAHTIGLLTTTPTITDGSDYFSITVVELH